MKKCILNLATRNGWYPEGQARLVNMLNLTGFYGDVKTWLGERSVRAPSHQQVPYAFKTYCFINAMRQNYDLALWLDCSVQPFKSINVVFDEIAKNNYYFENCGWSLGQWSSDASLQKAGISRDDAMNISMMSSGMVGMNLKSDLGKQFVQLWYEYAQDGVTFQGSWTNANKEVSADPRCLGHRHDQTAASIIAHKLGMKVSNSKYFQYAGSENTEHCVAMLKGGV